MPHAVAKSLLKQSSALCCLSLWVGERRAGRGISNTMTHTLKKPGRSRLCFQRVPGFRLRAGRLLSLGCTFRVPANSEFKYCRPAGIGGAYQNPNGWLLRSLRFLAWGFIVACHKVRTLLSWNKRIRPEV